MDLDEIVLGPDESEDILLQTLAYDLIAVVNTDFDRNTLCSCLAVEVDSATNPLV